MRHPSVTGNQTLNYGLSPSIAPQGASDLVKLYCHHGLSSNTFGIRHSANMSQLQSVASDQENYLVIESIAMRRESKPKKTKLGLPEKWIGKKIKNKTRDNVWGEFIFVELRAGRKDRFSEICDQTSETNKRMINRDNETTTGGWRFQRPIAWCLERHVGAHWERVALQNWSLAVVKGMTRKPSNSLPLSPQTLPTNKISFHISPIIDISVKAGSLNYLLVFV
jgi:hypothetical protein